MTGTSYRSSLSRSQGRKGWSITFRHPLINGPDGRPGRKVRKGLGTAVLAEAESLRDQLNALLADETLLTLMARHEAVTRFDPRVVDAFYDEVAPPVHDPWAIREQAIPLPGKEDGFARVLLLGTTGAGKTTIARQILGTDPRTERFPSTSTARTTTAEIELVLDEEPYRAIVTFLPRDRVTSYVEECVTAAVLAAAQQKDQAEIYKRLLQHSDQRFRLSYLLGTPSFGERDDEDEDEDVDEDQTQADELEEDVAFSGAERLELSRRLTDYGSRVSQLADETYDRLVDELGLPSGNQDDEETFQALLEEELQDQDDFDDLVNSIIDDIEERFDLLAEGQVTRDQTGWPSHWTWTCEDRREFITTINRFSSNYAPHFGRLLTPLVQGLRVAGPFRPAWADDLDTRVVLLDREGLGHTTETASSVPTGITSRYSLVDAILLVDNAAQPMQAAPMTALKSLVASGHINKLTIGFTHFDAVKGDNLPSTEAKMDHVRASLDGITEEMGRRWGAGTARAMERIRTDHSFFLANIDKQLGPKARRTRDQLRGLLGSLQRGLEPPAPVAATPTYDDGLLDPFIRDALDEFRDPWRARLGLGFQPGITKQHWTRIKALSRRYAYRSDDHYDYLQPVADLTDRLSRELRIFLDRPSRWNPANASEEEQQAVINAIAQEVFRRVSALARERLFLAQTPAWLTAFERSGKGSATTRAFDIEAIFDVAAPHPDERFSRASVEFQRELRLLVREAILEQGGMVLDQAAA